MNTAMNKTAMNRSSCPMPTANKQAGRVCSRSQLSVRAQAQAAPPKAPTLVQTESHRIFSEAQDLLPGA